MSQTWGNYGPTKLIKIGMRRFVPLWEVQWILSPKNLRHLGPSFLGYEADPRCSEFLAITDCVDDTLRWNKIHWIWRFPSLPWWNLTGSYPKYPKHPRTSPKGWMTGGQNLSNLANIKCSHGCSSGIPADGKTYGKTCGMTYPQIIIFIHIHPRSSTFIHISILVIW